MEFHLVRLHCVWYPSPGERTKAICPVQYLNSFFFENNIKTWSFILLRLSEVNLFIFILASVIYFNFIKNMELIHKKELVCDAEETALWLRILKKDQILGSKPTFLITIDK